MNDATAMHKFLEARIPKGQYFSKTLFNKDATRANIIAGFEKHLTQAKAGDIAFLYYSGHGSQEPCPPEFKALEPDGKNETIVCYDSRIDNGVDLADKELATLINLVAKQTPHFLVVMDCCHSGSGTRNITDDKADKTASFITRQIKFEDNARMENGKMTTRHSSAGKVRNIKDYYLPEDYKTRAIQQGTALGLTLPEGRHVQLAAAKSHQLAKETHLGGQRRGVFTFSLIETLSNTPGPISYQDVMRRVNTLVKQRTFDQDPESYAVQSDDITLQFLSGAAAKSIDKYQVMYNIDKARWEIDGGSVHGMLGGAVLNVYPDGTSADDMRIVSKSLGKVSVTEALVAQSVISPTGSLKLDPKKVYLARVDSLPVTPMNVKLTSGGKPEDTAALAEVKKAIQNSGSASSYIKLVDDIAQADFQVIARTVKNINTGAESGAFLVTRKTDTQPLIKQEIGYAPDKIANTVKNLVHIAKWNQTLKLENPGSSIPSTAVDIQIVKPTSPEQYPLKDGAVSFAYTKGVGNPDKFRVKLVNRHTGPLYCSLMYMSSNFENNPGLYPTGRLLLQPGQEAWALNGAAIGFAVDDAVVVFSGKKDAATGKTNTTVNEVFKLVMSTVDFDPMVMRQQALGLPDPATRSAGGSKGVGTRSLLIPTDDGGGGVFDDWNTNSLTLTITRTDNA